MSENWESVKDCGDKIYAYEWNNIMKYGLTKVDDWMILPFESGFRAINGESGMAYFYDADAGLVLQDVVDALPEGGAIGLKGLLLSKTKTSWTQDNIAIRARSQKTELRASAVMDSLLDFKGARFVHLDDLFINGYGLANKCVDASRPVSGVPVHSIQNTKVWGGIDCCIDLTGCEDSILRDVWCDGRKDASEPPTMYTKYGLRIGPGNTAGNPNIYGAKFMFLREADVFLKNVAYLVFRECLFASKSSEEVAYGSPDLIANIIIEGGANWWPKTVFSGSWWDGAIGTKPNILIRNARADQIILDGCFMNGSDVPNIYSALNPALERLTILGGFMQRTAGGHSIDAYINSVNIVNPQIHQGTVNLSKIGLYTVQISERPWIDSNFDYVLANNKGLWFRDTGGMERLGMRLGSDDVLAVRNDAGNGHIDVQPGVAGGRVKLYNSAVGGKWLGEFDGNWTRLVTRSDDPNTTGWGDPERGQFWFNMAAGAFKYWNGTAVKTISFT